MARITTQGGQLVRFDDEWLSIELNDSGESAFFFFQTSISRPHLGRHWWGVHRRLDEQGRTWSRNVDRLVVDDFGALVEVPA